MKNRISLELTAKYTHYADSLQHEYSDCPGDWIAMNSPGQASRWFCRECGKSHLSNNYSNRLASAANYLTELVETLIGQAEVYLEEEMFFLRHDIHCGHPWYIPRARELAAGWAIVCTHCSYAMEHTEETQRLARRSNDRFLERTSQLKRRP